MEDVVAKNHHSLISNSDSKRSDIPADETAVSLRMMKKEYIERISSKDNLSA